MSDKPVLWVFGMVSGCVRVKRVHQGLGIVKERWAIVYNLMLARQKELCNRCFSLSWHRSTEVVFIFVTLVQRDNLLIISSLERN